MHEIEAIIEKLQRKKDCNYDICSKIYDYMKEKCNNNFIRNDYCNKINNEYNKCVSEWAKCRKTCYSSYF